jgi:hypothetical protein
VKGATPLKHISSFICIPLLVALGLAIASCQARHTPPKFESHDGHSLTRILAEVVRERDFPTVDLLIGNNADEKS